MEIVLKAAFERDVDLVLVRAFADNNRVARLFLDKEDVILEVHHSAMELHGESDLQVVVDRKGKRHAILIEDKVDAQAQPEQYFRYCQRGQRGQEEARWADYTVYIAAPQKYLESDEEAKKYPHQVSYEDIHRELLQLNDPVSLAIIETALAKSAGSLPPVVDEAVTAFWENYYDYQAKHAPHLKLHINRGPKGPNATWPDFKTILPNDKILHKSEQGNVDLQFRGWAEKISELTQALQPYLDADMRICKAGESAVVRIFVPVMDFSKPFVQYEQQIASVFKAVEKLNQLAEQLGKNVPFA